MTADPAEALLRKLCERARDEGAPKLDAEALESAVMARVMRSSVDSLVVPRRVSRRYFWSAAGVAAAAVLLFFVGRWQTPGGSLEQSPHRGQLAQTPAMDGASLTPNQQLEAREYDLVVKHGSVAIWRLRAPGLARVVENGSRISIALEQGRIDAEIVPQPQPEVFAVEVERTRVAVHGTVFSVARHGDVAEVTVTEGSVRLGSIDHRGSPEGPLVEAPTRMSIDIRTIEAEHPIVARRPPAQRAMPSASARTASAATDASAPAESNRPARPAAGELERVWDFVAQAISECFAQNTVGDPNVRVSFGTQVTIRLTPDGSVVVGNLNPPVPQAVYDCYQRRLTHVSTPATLEGAELSRPSVLTR